MSSLLKPMPEPTIRIKRVNDPASTHNQTGKDLVAREIGLDCFRISIGVEFAAVLLLHAHLEGF